MFATLVFFFLLTGCILTHPALSLQYASLGLELWFTRMIPALLPFMILSGIMIQLQLTEKISMLLYPVLKPLYHVRKNVCYCILLGFLCGFPMGAKTVADLYERKKLTASEANFLLSFCNHIGPVYFCSFALPLLGRKLRLPYLLGMYAIPLLYGLVLRYTVYFRVEEPESISRTDVAFGNTKRKHISCRNVKIHWQDVLSATNLSITGSLQSILQLGGYMILFNLFNLLPHCLSGKPFPLLAPLLEISGGLLQLQDSLPLYSLLAVSFGGLSCIAQTYSCISKTDLSLSDYIIHKTILTLFTLLFYLGWRLLFPGSFLS